MLKKIVFLLVVITMLFGCTVTRTNEAEAAREFLTPSGWSKPSRFLTHSSFRDYAESIRAEVKQNRIPFEPDRADKEVKMASPAEYLPAESCTGNAEGIAILVHGLSDTAYAMEDIAKVLSNACYISRTVLLPGHGTRAGDMKNVRLKHWSDTLDYLIDQASAETDNVLLVGFSLGAVLTLEKALSRSEDIDGIIALSPAYYLSSYRAAKWSRWLHRVVPWIDRGVSDDAMRYEAMPTRGVVETVNAIRKLNKKLERHGALELPWLLAQSLDDAVVIPAKNQQLWEEFATHPESRLIRFYSDKPANEKPNVIDISGTDKSQRVLGLSHLAIHISPENTHYGRNGDYRNCGLTAPRDRAFVKRCEQEENVWYGLWKSETESDLPLAISTFNPSFEQFASELSSFARRVAEQAK